VVRSVLPGMRVACDPTPRSEERDITSEARPDIGHRIYTYSVMPAFYTCDGAIALSGGATPDSAVAAPSAPDHMKHTSQNQKWERMKLSLGYAESILVHTGLAHRLPLANTAEKPAHPSHAHKCATLRHENRAARFAQRACSTLSKRPLLRQLNRARVGGS